MKVDHVCEAAPCEVPFDSGRTGHFLRLHVLRAVACEYVTPCRAHCFGGVANGTPFDVSINRAAIIAFVTMVFLRGIEAASTCCRISHTAKMWYFLPRHVCEEIKNVLMSIRML